MELGTAHRLAIDVGNSRIKLGLFAISPPPARGALPTCLQRIVVPASEDVPWNTLLEWKAACPSWRPAVMAGSNPHGVERLLAEWPISLGPSLKHITNTDEFPLLIRVGEPRRVGIDRLLNAVAVNELRQADQLAVVVDSGTATTVDLIAADGGFSGGAILPGLALSAKALHEYTALLPLVSVAELGQDTPEPIGQNTRAAISSGLFWGQLGAVKELIDRQGGANAEVFVTGGGGALLTTYLPRARFEPHLALQGLVLVATRLEQSLDETDA